ncbi:hypothetical protein PanWU01x14_168230 [Parasponia andersonii]|uniref:Reverse transcriptase n=1 Tax=Parasponia andersonii TaxID=3476 RepID=A0A2P5CB51_PARAD|nr:hypothetical protein PanWU01x14_168230 [Parasponia andersonii]
MSQQPSHELMDIILDKVQPKVNCDMNEYLIRLFSFEEVYMAVKDMGSNKSPSLDGLSAMFYQNYWHIVGPLVTRVVLDFLHRLITNNMLVAYKIIHAMKCRKYGKRQFFAMKLDMSKAYDRIE